MRVDRTGSNCYRTDKITRVVFMLRLLQFATWVKHLVEQYVENKIKDYIN